MSAHTLASAVNARYQALRDSTSRTIRKIDLPQDNLGRTKLVSEYFSCNTFGKNEIKAALADADYQLYEQTLLEGKKLDIGLADKIAKAIRTWAAEKGISHFCHWFQPMTGSTAEKHDAFLSFNKNGQPIETFSGSQLIQSEPDASSFPSGGMRATFEARGYTVWDPSSPLFIMESTNGRTLCIPSAFISYTGHALDEKAPLLRSLEALNRNAIELLKTLGDDSVRRVSATLGAEQEYFLIDRAFLSLRPDLLLCGRSLIGAQSPKSHELDDHYFGTIPSRVNAFMAEVEYELYRLGVPAKTRHNEVAPAQFEIAPIFTEANLAVGHNHLIMDILGKVATRHSFALLLHEKPFSEINGNGKHNNWSIGTDKGENLLEPGATPHENLRFLVVLCSVLKAVNKHSGALRAAIANAGNDHRLGGNEAPPAIISVFLGSELTRILDKLKVGEAIENAEKAIIDLGVDKIPHVSKDNTDRNRTSPFAFTGNKFEFRSVGGSASCSAPMTCLNAAVAEAMGEVNQRLVQAFSDSNDRENAVLKVVRELITETESIRFEGNNYGQEWVKEAERRGLPNLKNTPEALSALKKPETQKLYSELGILDADEQTARLNVAIETYNKKIDIEWNTMMRLLDMYVVPAATAYLADLASSVDDIKDIEGTSTKLQTKLIKKLSGFLDELDQKKEAFETVALATAKIENEEQRATDLADKVLPAMEATREVVDRIENIVSDSYWPLPKYREVLFLR